MDKTRDLFAKTRDYRDPQMVQSQGLYPYFRAIEATKGSSVIVKGTRRVMIGSNNYLGLTHHPRVMKAAKDAIDQYGTGCTGSRFLNGNLKLHEELEERLCAYLEKECCLVVTTGFISNLAVLATLSGRKDVYYSDRENHASIVEGQRLAVGKTVKFRHNDMADLRRVLETTRDRFEGAMIVADGVFSMSGDIINLPEMLQLAKEFDCRVYIDDAHSLGVIGPQGQGAGHHFGLQNEVDLCMATFSKSFAGLGGYIAGEFDIINYLKHKARPFIFSAASPPAAVATALECLKIIQEEPQHLANLRQNAEKMRKGFRRLGFNTLNSQTPIIPILVGSNAETFRLTQALYENGIFATPVVSPAVPENCSLIRTSYMATHQEEDLDYVLKVFEKLGREFGIIENAAKERQLADLAHAHFGVEAAL